MLLRRCGAVAEESSVSVAQGTEGQIAALKDTLAEMEEQLVVEEGTLKGMEWEFRMAEQRRKATADAWQQAKQRAAGMRELLNGALGRKAELEEEKGEHEVRGGERRGGREGGEKENKGRVTGRRRTRE